MLKVENINVYYERIHALKNLSLEVKQGEIVTILGANGAGKTTTLNSIIGVTRAKSGKISFQGIDITTADPSKIVEMGLAISPEGRKIFPKMTVYENLEMGAYVLNSPQRIHDNIMRAFNYFPVLRERSGQISSTLSGGEQQMLAIARALMANPKLLLLDEPSLGLAPLLVKDIFRIVKEINKDGVTVMLVEQNAKQALQIAHRGYVIETGRVFLEGSREELINDKRIIDAYLGGK
ncbi:MAG: ABC transporter ATP-binding protein [Synergistaceae bacterium]|nr:ABC transporter ATP-binding protein [Synergistaceae bacterium]